MDDECLRPVDVTKVRYSLEMAQFFLSQRMLDKFIDCMRLWRAPDEPPRDAASVFDLDLSAPLLWQCCPTVDDETAADEAQ